MTTLSSPVGVGQFVRRSLAVVTLAAGCVAPGLVRPAAAQSHSGFTQAIAHAETTVRVRTQTGPPRDLAEALNQLGRLWLEEGDPAPARPALSRALAIADSLGDSSLRSEILRNLSWAHLLDEDHTGAEARGREAVAAAMAAGDSSEVHDAASLMGFLAFDRGRAAEAEAWFERALALSHGLASAVHAADLIALANARQVQGGLDSAETGHREALALARRIQAPDLEWAALLGLGDVELRRRDYPGAMTSYLDAVAVTDSLRTRQDSRIGTPAGFASRMKPYEAIIQVLARLDPEFPDSGYAARAFEWAERARARSLLDRRSALGIDSAGGHDPDAVLRLEDAQGLLPSKRVAMLYFSVGDSSTSLWVLRRDDWRHFRLPSRRALRARIRTIRSGLVDPSRAGDRTVLTASHQLYRALIEPAEPMLKGVNEIVVVPDGDLSWLPFEALLGFPSGDLGPTPRDYLVSRFVMTYAPSATMLARLGGKGTAGAIVGVGNPAFGASPPGEASSVALKPLPGTGSEVEILSKLARKRAFLGLTGADANRSNLLANPELPGAEILHIASYGVVNELEPGRSGVWLAPDPGSRGPSFLSLADVARLRWSPRQVTLSACETSLSRTERGEGVLGLALGFLSSGAQSVLVSQWRVHDPSTARLMERFYTRLLNEGASRASALADAKRILLQDAETRSPYFWASFVLVGNPGPLN